MIPKQTEIQFHSNSYPVNSLIADFDIKWRPNMTHLLVTISDMNDHLVKIFLTDTPNTTQRLILSSLQGWFVVKAYGLGMDEALRQGDTTVYSVEAVHKETLIPGLAKGFNLKYEIDLSRCLGGTQMSCLRSENTFNAEVSEDAPMKYELKTDLPMMSTASVLCSVYNERQKKEYLIISKETNFIPLVPISVSRTEFKVQAVALYRRKQESRSTKLWYTPLGSSQVLNLKTCMDQQDLQTLYRMAERYCRSHANRATKYPVESFYRNKPAEYYIDIMKNRRGLMKKYDKDNNGDPYSPINHNIQGLFFSASLDNRGQPPNFSFFGNLRLFLPVEALLSDDVNMYFADFHCNNSKSHVHYVTVVITKRYSKEDIFCKQRLLKLEMDNPFFSVRDGHFLFTPRTLMLASVNKFHVEFLYTEDVDIAGLMRTYGVDRVCWKGVTTKGRGRSLPDGIPKVPNCRVCNLHENPSASMKIHSDDLSI